METFFFYIQLGFEHVTDINGLDHFYFIIALCLPFGWRQWKKLLWWVTLFTLGHSLSLIGNYYAGLRFSSYWIELLIPITIAMSCWPVLRQHHFNKNSFASTLTFFFGLIHGLGFGRYFSMMVRGEEAALSLFSFAVGVELAQLLIVLGVVGINALLGKSEKRLGYWQRGVGIVIFLLALTMLVERI